MLLMIMPFSLRAADEANNTCALASITSAFKEYVLGIDQGRVEMIQQQLNDGAYGELEIDGVMGSSTRLALQKVCLDFDVESGEHLADQIVLLLDLNSAVSSLYPAWRQTVASAPFKQWLAGQSSESQTQAALALKAGPAEQVIELLDQFAKQAALATPAVPAPEPPPAVKVVKRPPPDPGDSPAVYYRWAAEQEKSGEEDAAQPAALPDDVLAKLALIEGIAYPDRRLFKQALAALFNGSGIDYQTVLNEIVTQARRGPLPVPGPVQLSGEGCGCSRDFSSLVYGFYPYWLAQPDQVQALDFSLFDRIAFYALSLDANGNIANPLQWSDVMNAAEFINAAHKHRVAVDLTVYAPAWRQWSDQSITTAVESVVQQVTHEFSADKINLARSFMPFVEDISRPRADGLTLYFDDYSASTEGGERLIDFISRVSKRLIDIDDKIKLNIMFGLDVDTLEQQQAFKALSAILLDKKSSTARVDQLFILLQEPTTDAKKKIRRAVEEQFRGPDRKAVLRKIVPVIGAAGHDKDPRGAYTQFTDDLIYFQDNFAGVGFWPLPLRDDAGADQGRDKVVELYTAPEAGVAGMIDGYFPELCQFVCPNRWLFRIGFDLLAGALLLYALLACFYLRLRQLYKRYFLYFIAALLLTVLIALISLVCDPFWKEKADAVLLLAMLGGGGYILLTYVNKATRPPLP